MQPARTSRRWVCNGNTPATPVGSRTPRLRFTLPTPPRQDTPLIDRRSVPPRRPGPTTPAGARRGSQRGNRLRHQTGAGHRHITAALDAGATRIMGRRRRGSTADPTLRKTLEDRRIGYVLANRQQPPKCPPATKLGKVHTLAAALPARSWQRRSAGVGSPRAPDVLVGVDPDHGSTGHAGMLLCRNDHTGEARLLPDLIHPHRSRSLIAPLSRAPRRVVLDPEDGRVGARRNERRIGRRAVGARDLTRLVVGFGDHGTVRKARPVCRLVAV